MRLRTDDVFVRVDEAGEPVSEGGRVEIRYRADAMRAYRAALRNLSASVDTTVFPDTHCAVLDGVEVQSSLLGTPAQTVPSATPAPVAKKTRAAKSPTPALTAPEVPAAAPSSARAKTAADTVIAYADGACSGNPGPCGLGLVLLDGHHRIERSEYLGTGTNNIAELTAIRRALEAIASPRPIAIHTDSQYSIGVLSKGWKPKANQQLIAEIKALLAGRPGVSLRYVPGHSGVPLNERADELARESVRSRRTVETAHGPKNETQSAAPIAAASQPEKTPAPATKAPSPARRSNRSAKPSAGPTRSGR